MAQKQNIVVGLFDVESEAFQAMTELRQDPGNEKSFLSSAALVKNENGKFRTLDAFDTGAQTTDDTEIGGLVGALFGVLGGPIGVLLCSSYGALLGSAFDAGDALMEVSMFEQIAKKSMDGDIAIIGLVYEEDETVLDEKLGKFKATIARFDAATVAAEVEEAEKMEEELARQARQQLRDAKKAEFREKIAAGKEKLAADWEALKANITE